MLFRGSAPALVTPFRKGKVDHDAIRALTRFQLASGSDALVICGTTGEPSTMTAEEQSAAVQTVVETAAGAVPIIVGIGGNNTAHVIEAAMRAEQTGIDGLLAVTPYYNKTTQDGLVAHYTAIADATALPIMVYNVPSRTGVNLLPKTMSRIADHPQIDSIKEASGDICQIMELFRLCRGRIGIYSGNDDHVVPMVALGGDGVVSVAANIIPRQMHEMVAAVHRGDLQSGTDLQLTLLPLINALFTEVNPIPIKAALALMGMIENELRLPLVPLSPANTKLLSQRLEDLNLL